MMNINEKIFLAGVNGMVGSAIKKELIQKGYGDPSLGGIIFCPTRKELDLLREKKI